MKNFKTFLSWLLYKDIYAPNFNKFDEATNVSLLEKDGEFILDSAKFDTTHDNIPPDYKVQFDKLNSFKQKPDFDKLKDTFVAFQIKINTIGLKENSLSFKQLNEISKTFCTENLYISGDGNDWQMSEHTGGHDSEIILTISLDKVSHLMSQYEDWMQKREQIKNTKKILKGIK